MNPLHISFDFDGTLTLPHVRDYFTALSHNDQHYLYIVTRRYQSGHPAAIVDEHSDPLALAEALTIPVERVVFTDRAYKAPILNSLGVDVHLDDDHIEGLYIRQQQGRCRFLCLDASENPGLRSWQDLLDEMLGVQRTGFF